MEKELNAAGHSKVAPISLDPENGAQDDSLIDPDTFKPKHAPGEKSSVLPGFILPPRSELGLLTGVYFEHSNFFSPILDKSSFERGVDGIYDRGSDQLLSDPKTAFRFCIVLATSVRLRNCTDSSFSVSASQRYFAAAKTILETYPQIFWTEDLDNLECLLLIVQYAMFSSDLAVCSQHLTLATRLAISLQLHLPTPRGFSIDHNELSILGNSNAIHDRGLWLFWATYNFERNLSSSLKIRSTIPDDAIRVPLPPNPDNDHITALAIHILRHRQIESEIERYRSEMVQPENLNANFRDWKAQIHSRLIQWKEQCPIFIKPTALVPPDMIDGLFSVAIVRLYSSPLQPIAHFDDATSTAVLVQHAVKSIAIYKKTFREGRLRFFWRTLHNIYLCGSALVQAYKRLLSWATPPAGIDLDDLRYSLTVCSAVLWGMAERYPAGTRFRDDFDVLVADILHTRPRADYIDFLDFSGNQPYGKHSTVVLSDDNAFDELECIR